MVNDPPNAKPAAGDRLAAGDRPAAGSLRQAVIKALIRLGWRQEQLLSCPEWPIPDTPQDLIKRERGQPYTLCGRADLVAFADGSHQSHALQVIFELKAPVLAAGRDRLIRYLSREPLAKMGFWTNGTESLTLYKRPSAAWMEVKGARLPAPHEDLTQPPEAPPTWNDLSEPGEAELSAVLRRVLVTVVTKDSRVTRREEQLRELLHVLLVKLESDAFHSRSGNRDKPLDFRLHGDRSSRISPTAHRIRQLFRDYVAQQHSRLFHPGDREDLLLSDETLYAVVAELWPYRLLGDDIEVLSKAFQIFRTSALKSGEGQYLTPLRILRPAVMALEITAQDRVIDPACGTGGFLIEALRQVAASEFSEAAETETEIGAGAEIGGGRLVDWARDNLCGVDKDDIGIKLTRAELGAMGVESSAVLLGDAVRINQWPSTYPRLAEALGAKAAPFVQESFSVVVTNPPFGEALKVSASDCRDAGYTISLAASPKAGKHVDLEIGLVYLELAYRLLRMGGRVGIILPETYFFSKKYHWLPPWLEGRFTLRGMLNIPMEAFEEFCRAKTNFYIFEKTGSR